MSEGQNWLSERNKSVLLCLPSIMLICMLKSFSALYFITCCCVLHEQVGSLSTLNLVRLVWMLQISESTDRLVFSPELSWTLVACRQTGSGLGTDLFLTWCFCVLGRGRWGGGWTDGKHMPPFALVAAEMVGSEINEDMVTQSPAELILSIFHFSFCFSVFWAKGIQSRSSVN